MRNLKNLREKAGLTQADMAHELGFATQYWQQIEDGRRNPRTPTTVRISQILAKRLKRSPASVLTEITGVNDNPKNEPAAVSAGV